MKKQSVNFPKSEAHGELRAILLDLYWRCVSRPIPVDAIISFVFRHQKEIAPKAKGFLASATYGLLRQRYKLYSILSELPSAPPECQLWDGRAHLEGLLPPETEAIAAFALWLLTTYELTETEWKEAMSEAFVIWPEISIKDEYTPEIEDLPYEMLEDLRDLVLTPEFSLDWKETVYETGLPKDVFDRWIDHFGLEEAQKLGASWQEPAPLDIRVNRLKGTREELIEVLKEQGITGEASPLSPDGIRMPQKQNIFRTNAFEEGWFEVQDTGSQLVGFACNPRPNWKVLDACSGGGGKSLHLAALMENRGSIFCHDSDAERLNSQRKRLKRAKAHNVRIMAPGTSEIQAPYDLVLIDAPCLGLGTIRRNPDFLWRGPLEYRIREIQGLQRECIESYAQHVKPGGILMYVTCSFEPEETIQLLDSLPYIQENFVPDALTPNFEYHGISQQLTKSNSLSLLPHQHLTDGFFMARFRRKM